LLADRLIQAYGGERRPRYYRVLQFLLQDAGFRRACRNHELSVGNVRRMHPEMAPAPGRRVTWDVPALVTVGELAEWLELQPKALDWFADLRGLERTVAAGPLRHYRYHWLAKRAGGSARLIEAPKPRLKAIQRRVLHGILDQIPPHAVAHGFFRGRSTRSFVAPHVGQPLVLRTDLKDFFPSVPRSRVVAVFCAAGYPEEVSRYLAGLCTNLVPPEVWESFPQYQYGTIGDRWRHDDLHRRPHLPQGAPTSPALANLCSYRLDCRLAGLARSFAAQYTRYADDLLFSGGAVLARSIRYFHAAVCAIAMDEGFQVNARKTRIMRSGVRQHAAGLVLNQGPNIARDEFDRLKAILYNCVRQGPASQNRGGLPDFRSHLAGRIAFVESVHPARGQRLRELFDRIEWTSD
jgi:hypothetical protein